MIQLPEKYKKIFDDSNERPSSRNEVIFGFFMSLFHLQMSTFCTQSTLALTVRDFITLLITSCFCHLFQKEIKESMYTIH